MPDEPCVDKIVKWIDSAEESIIVQAYSFSSKKIAAALIGATQNKVYFESKDAVEFEEMTPEDQKKSPFE